MNDPRVKVLADYVATLQVDRGRTFDAATPLLTERILDSMGMVMLAAFVEERFGVRVDDAEFRAGGLERLGDVLALVDRARG